MRAALIALAALLALGCDSGGGGPTRPDAAAADAGEGLSCADEYVVRARVFEAHCADSDCHDADRPKADLDLVTPGVTSRIQTMTSIHEECAERHLVIAGDPQASFLFDKLLSREGPCGDPMPLDTELPLEERRCLVEWITAME